MCFIKTILPILFICLLLNSCKTDSGDLYKNAKQQIAQAEKDFEKMAAEKGIADAFEFFADSNAVIRRSNDSIIQGKENIRKFYSADFFKAASVKWSPDFVDASEKGDLGYTYGKYIWQSKDSVGKVTENKGIFHTVWKKQKDGSWKYVWD